MTGCVLSRKCAVACRKGEESQQATWPHERHSRRWTQFREPIARQSVQPSVELGVTSRIWSRCVQVLTRAPLARLPEANRCRAQHCNLPRSARARPAWQGRLAGAGGEDDVDFDE